MSDEQFKELSKEVIPLIEQMIEISKKHVSVDKLCSVTFAGKGYFVFDTHASDAYVYRTENMEEPCFALTEGIDVGTD